jgi:hypothetical protein
MAKTIKYRKKKKSCKKGGTTPRKSTSSSKLTLKIPSPPRPRRVPSRPNLSLIRPDQPKNLFSSSSPPRRGVPPPQGMNLSLQNPADMSEFTRIFDNTLKLDSESTGNTTKSDKPKFNFDNVEDPNKRYYNLNSNSRIELSQPGWVRYEVGQPSLEPSDKDRLLELEKRTLELELAHAAEERNKHVTRYASPSSHGHIAVQPIKTPTPKQSPAVGFHLSAIKSDKSSGLRTKRGRSPSQSPSRPTTANLFHAPTKKTRKNTPK